MSLFSRIHAYLIRKESSAAQFVKYVMCGGVSVAVDMTIYLLLAWLVFPCLKPGDPFVQVIEYFGLSIQDIDPDLILRNYWIIKMFCFVAANVTVYFLNIKYVFESGKHRRLYEVILFFGISLAVFLGGTWVGALLIDLANWHITYTYMFILVASVALNYILRKFVVFMR